MALPFSFRSSPSSSETSPFSYCSLKASQLFTLPLKYTSGDKEQSLNLFQATLRSTVIAKVQQGANLNSAAPPAQGSGVFLLLSNKNPDSVTSSQAPSLTLLYTTKHIPLFSDADS